MTGIAGDQKTRLLRFVDEALEHGRIEQITALGIACPHFSCSADLFLNLWTAECRPVAAITTRHNSGPDVVMALLLERDAHSMPIHAIVAALHFIWIFAWGRLKFLRETVEVDNELLARVGQAARAERRRSQAQIQVARTKSAASRTTAAIDRNNIIFEMAVETNLKEGFPPIDHVASVIFRKVHTWTGFEGLTEGGIRRKISGAKTEAMQRSARRP